MSRSFILFILVSVALAGSAWAQCPMCKSALDSSDPAAAAYGSGFSWGTLVLVPAPFLLLGLMGLVFWNSFRKARSRESLAPR
ncbi:MAG: hypothetical protein O6952_07135 [Planctomycetota bacterium]|nr:hypothetical protein [Planctomycetota bacterium]MCZ6691745.1 hypothetical protein [Planctomycetota bacterium]